jgi:RNA polymerase sigma factor (TIGR02999 family)
VSAEAILAAAASAELRSDHPLGKAIVSCVRVQGRPIREPERFAKGAGKRGGQAVRMELNESLDACPLRPEQLIRLDDALLALAELDPRKAKVVELRFFGGLTAEETAAVLKVSSKSVLRDWSYSRAWLMIQLK